MELCVLVWPYYLRTDKTCKSSTSANKQTSLRLASEACIPVENRFSSPACLLPCVCSIKGQTINNGLTKRGVIKSVDKGNHR